MKTMKGKSASATSSAHTSAMQNSQSYSVKDQNRLKLRQRLVSELLSNKGEFMIILCQSRSVVGDDAALLAASLLQLLRTIGPKISGIGESHRSSTYYNGASNPISDSFPVESGSAFQNTHYEEYNQQLQQQKQQSDGLYNRVTENFLTRTVRNRVSYFIRLNKNVNDMIRDNSVASMLFSNYMRTEGSSYLKETLSKPIHDLINSGKDLEIDPEKLKMDMPEGSVVTDTLKHETVSQNAKLLESFCETILCEIIDRAPDMPQSMKRVCQLLWNEMNDPLIQSTLSSPNSSDDEINITKGKEPSFSGSSKIKPHKKVEKQASEMSALGKYSQLPFLEDNIEIQVPKPIHAVESNNAIPLKTQLRKEDSMISNDSNLEALFQTRPPENRFTKSNSNSLRARPRTFTGDEHVLENLKSSTWTNQSLIPEISQLSRISPLNYSMSSNGSFKSTANQSNQRPRRKSVADIDPRKISYHLFTDSSNKSDESSFVTAQSSLPANKMLGVNADKFRASISSARESNGSKDFFIDNSKLLAEKVVGTLLFLRFFIPAIIAPDQYGIVPMKTLTSKHRRALVLGSKVLGNLCHQVKFGRKEPCMMVMNRFLKEKIPLWKFYLESICDLNLHEEVVAQSSTLEGRSYNRALGKKLKKRWESIELGNVILGSGNGSAKRYQNRGNLMLQTYKSLPTLYQNKDNSDPDNSSRIIASNGQDSEGNSHQNSRKPSFGMKSSGGSNQLSEGYLRGGEEGNLAGNLQSIVEAEEKSSRLNTLTKDHGGKGSQVPHVASIFQNQQVANTEKSQEPKVFSQISELKGTSTQLSKFQSTSNESLIIAAFASNMIILNQEQIESIDQLFSVLCKLKGKIMGDLHGSVEDNSEASHFNKAERKHFLNWMDQVTQESWKNESTNNLPRQEHGSGTHIKNSGSNMAINVASPGQVRHQTLSKPEESNSKPTGIKGSWLDLFANAKKIGQTIKSNMMSGSLSRSKSLNSMAKQRDDSKHSSTHANQDSKNNTEKGVKRR